MELVLIFVWKNLSNIKLSVFVVVAAAAAAVKCHYVDHIDIKIMNIAHSFSGQANRNDIQ
jgi:hypothetical protein